LGEGGARLSAAQLPDQEPIRIWSNFEFIADDGSINEVDALVLSAAGLFLVEIKSRPGVIEGDTHTWTWTEGAIVHAADNPLLLANLKAKRLKTLLKRQKSLQKSRMPYLEPLIFCSVAGQRLKLDGAALMRVHLREDASDAARAGQSGIVTALTAVGGSGSVGLPNRSGPQNGGARLWRRATGTTTRSIRPVHSRDE